MNGHLVPGDVITKLDDFNLGSDVYQDSWSQYFLEPDKIPAPPSTGWCVDTEWLQGNFSLTTRRYLLTTFKVNKATAVLVMHRIQSVLPVFRRSFIQRRKWTAALTLYP